jgi:hypothetical protein
VSVPATSAPTTSAPPSLRAATPSAPPRAAVASDAGASEPPRAAPSKKGAALVYGLAAAAVAIAGVGLAMRAPSGNDRATERANLELDPATRAESTKSQAVPAPVTPAAAPSTAEPSPADPSTVSPTAAEPSPTGSEASAADADPAEEAPEDPDDAKGATDKAGAGEDKASPEAAAAPEAPTSGTPILVTVHIYPPEAEIYHKGKRLGRSGQQIEVLPGERKLLVLIRDGYWPRKLILDGKETTYNIGLRKQPDGTTGAASTPQFTPTTP